MRLAGVRGRLRSEVALRLGVRGRQARGPDRPVSRAAGPRRVRRRQGCVLPIHLLLPPRRAVLLLLSSSSFLRPHRAVTLPTLPPPAALSPRRRRGQQAVENAVRRDGAPGRPPGRRVQQNARHAAQTQGGGALSAARALTSGPEDSGGAGLVFARNKPWLILTPTDHAAPLAPPSPEPVQAVRRGAGRDGAHLGLRGRQVL